MHLKCTCHSTSTALSTPFPFAQECTCEDAAQRVAAGGGQDASAKRSWKEVHWEARSIVWFARQFPVPLFGIHWPSGHCPSCFFDVFETYVMPLDKLDAIAACAVSGYVGNSLYMDTATNWKIKKQYLSRMSEKVIAHFIIPSQISSILFGSKS